ncbi:hypothetical protein ACFWWC_00750 [Streptomyces sp. NPDC058642]|uniref:hypothetical protein n=1 Tax=Streptomyces sp. NPDC058642 TaxID=3346572 RepID=UPI00365EF10A
MSSETCAARRPGFDQRPPIGRNSLPCTQPAYHQGDHSNDFGDRWPVTAREKALAELEADYQEFLATLLKREEWKHIARKLEGCYKAMWAGDDSILLRQRIERLEALQAALCGTPERLAA